MDLPQHTNQKLRNYCMLSKMSYYILPDNVFVVTQSLTRMRSDTYNHIHLFCHKDTGDYDVVWNIHMTIE